MKPWTTADFFTCKSGSQVWPSSDPADSPYDTFTCKLCGYQFKEQMYGNFSMRLPHGDELAERKMQEHIAMFHKDEIADGSVVEAVQTDLSAGLGIIELSREMIDKMVAEGIRVGAAPWCCCGEHEHYAHIVIEQKLGRQIHQETREETLARRASEKTRTGEAGL